MSGRDAANELGVHFTTLYRWVKSNKIVYIMFGGNIFVPFLEVERLKKQRAGSQGKEVFNEAEVASSY